MLVLLEDWLLGGLALAMLAWSGRGPVTGLAVLVKLSVVLAPSLGRARGLLLGRSRRADCARCWTLHKNLDQELKAKGAPRMGRC